MSLGRRLRPWLAAALVLLGAGPGRAQGPGAEGEDLLEALLATLLGLGEVTPRQLQDDVSEAGGLSFRADVPVEFMSRDDLRRYLRELFDAEYPEAKARADRRLLTALDLLPPEADLRQLRLSLLEENVVGFYDERPSRRRLYAVSADRRLTPSNQLVLSHELRHAQQDQYADLHAVLPAEVGDFDDRRLALMSALEGDATLVMERFLALRARKLLEGATGEEAPLELADEAPGLVMPGLADLPVPPVLREQLLQPYLAGRRFAWSVWRQGGWEAVRRTWARPPRSMEQVLHPEKYFSGEEPRAATPPLPPPGAKPLLDGVLGELLVGTLLEGQPEAAAAGWGGDRYLLVETAGGGTLLSWRTVWDTPEDARQFFAAASARFAARHAPQPARGPWQVYGSGAWRFAFSASGSVVDFASSDDGAALERLLPASSR